MTVKRVPVDYDFGGLNPAFLKAMARIAAYAASKYGSWEQYAEERLKGEKSPINHAMSHILQYELGELHDHFGDVGFQLVAAAYNLMMEFHYVSRFGHVRHPLTVDEVPIKTKRRR